MCSFFYLFSLGNLFFVLVVYLILGIFFVVVVVPVKHLIFLFNTRAGTEHLLQLKHWYLAPVKSLLL